MVDIMKTVFFDHESETGKTTPDQAIYLDNVSYTWQGQEKPVLVIPSFQVDRGEHVFLAGPSGSGKSTLLGLVAGILAADTGRVFINGTCISALNGSERDIFRGDHIGFIFQQFNLIPYLSIIENILIPCHFSALRNMQAEEQAGNALQAAQDLLTRLDLDASLWHQKANKLSVGQQQRVAAARALIGRPALLIADEPTSALDADRRKTFLQLLLKECQAMHSTLLFVSHDQSLAENFSRNVQLTELNRALD